MLLLVASEQGVTSSAIAGEHSPTTDTYRYAARAIEEADYLLVATGAGFSADSSLPVYDDIAAVPAYRRKGLTYSDLCRGSLLDDDPSAFYGFWGQVSTFLGLGLGLAWFQGVRALSVLLGVIGQKNFSQLCLIKHSHNHAYIIFERFVLLN
jgi:hypothetical protein